MRNKLYWGIAILIILLIGTAGVLFIQHNRAELAQFEREIHEANELLQKSDNARQQTPKQASLSGAISKPAPPIGETEDTGHWDGNTWHQTKPPKPKKSWWSEDTNKLRLKLVHGEIPGGEYDAFARRVIAEHPYSEAALEARLHFDSGTVEGIENLKVALKYHPESPRFLSEIAWSGIRFPEESVAFAKKALRFLPNSSEDYSHLSLVFTPSVQSHATLGRAYQRLGDYKAALVHLKTAQRLLKPGIAGNWGNTIAYDSMSNHIAAIKAGKPILGPDKKQQPEQPSGFPLFPSQSTPMSDPVGVSEAPLSPGSFDFPTTPPDVMDFDPANPSFPYEKSMRTREAYEKSMRTGQAAEQAQADFARHQQQEFEGFLRWMETIENAKSPADLDDFLMREMATQLQGGNAKFTPDRLIRAFETFHRHGETAGMTHLQLQKIDPDIAKAMSRHPRRPPVPPRTAPHKNK